MFDLPPMLFMAIASVSWASAEIDPYDMAPVEKRFRISVAGSTSAMSIGARPSAPGSRNVNNPRKVASVRDWSSTLRLYSLKMS